MYPHDTKEVGIKKLEGSCGTYYYSSKDDPKNPKREAGIYDDTALQVAEAFEKKCDHSAANVGDQIVAMHHHGGIQVQTYKGMRFYHVRRKGSSKVALEIVAAH